MLSEKLKKNEKLIQKIARICLYSFFIGVLFFVFYQNWRDEIKVKYNYTSFFENTPEAYVGLTYSEKYFQDLVFKQNKNAVVCSNHGSIGSISAKSGMTLNNNIFPIGVSLRNEFKKVEITVNYYNFDPTKIEQPFYIVKTRLNEKLPNALSFEKVFNFSKETSTNEVFSNDYTIENREGLDFMLIKPEQFKPGENSFTFEFDITERSAVRNYGIFLVGFEDFKNIQIRSVEGTFIKQPKGFRGDSLKEKISNLFRIYCEDC